MNEHNLNIAGIEQLNKLLGHLPSLMLPQVSLGKFITEYLSYIESNRSFTYYQSHNNSFTHLVADFEEQKLISTITFKDAEAFITRLKFSAQKGYRVYYRNLRAAFNKAVDWGYISENPFAKIKLPKVQKTHPVFISEKELHEILDHIKIVVIKDIATLSFFTGCRVGEIVNLKWNNINIEEGYIVVGDTEFTTKTRSQRVIPICSHALDLLRGKLENSNNEGFVFAKTDGESFTPNYISKMFKKGCKEAGVSETIHFHTLRHSFASTLVQKGVSIYVIQKLLGHSSVKTTEIYSHLHNDTLKEAIKVLNN